MMEIARRLITGRKVIALAGAAEPLTTEKIEVFMVLLSADLSNINPISAGGPETSATPGASKGAILVPGNPPCMFLVRNLGDIYVNAQTNGDAVCYVAFQA